MIVCASSPSGGIGHRMERNNRLGSHNDRRECDSEVLGGRGVVGIRSIVTIGIGTLLLLVEAVAVMVGRGLLMCLDGRGS